MAALQISEPLIKVVTGVHSWECRRRRVPWKCAVLVLGSEVIVFREGSLGFAVTQVIQSQFSLLERCTAV